MRIIRSYIPVVHTIFMSVLLGLSLALFFNSPGQVLGWVALVCTIVFGMLMLDSVQLTRRTLFKVRQQKLYGKTLAKTVETIWKPKPYHPTLDYHIALYYEVPVLTGGGTEYVARLEFYKWLARVWAFQNSPYRGTQQSPLAQRRWEGELGGTNRYLAYMYLLDMADAIDPESTYHIKKLRLSPWNIIIILDERLTVRQL